MARSEAYWVESKDPEFHNVTPQMMLDEVSALTNAGSLLSPRGEIVAPYDLEVSNSSRRVSRARTF